MRPLRALALSLLLLFSSLSPALAQSDLDTLFAKLREPDIGSNVLRIEPSMTLTDADIAHVETAFGRLCEIVRNQDALHLVYPLTDSGRKKPRQTVLDYRNIFPPQPSASSQFPPTRPVRKVAFIKRAESAIVPAR